MGNGAIYLAGIIFGIMALVHLGRLFCPFQIAIGTFFVPEWFSYVGFIFFGFLSVYLFRSKHIVPKV